jgi:hypothetical protein
MKKTKKLLIPDFDSILNLTDNDFLFHCTINWDRYSSQNKLLLCKKLSDRIIKDCTDYSNEELNKITEYVYSKLDRYFNLYLAFRSFQTSFSIILNLIKVCSACVALDVTLDDLKLKRLFQNKSGLNDYIAAIYHSNKTKEKMDSMMNIFKKMISQANSTSDNSTSDSNTTSSVDIDEIIKNMKDAFKQ